MFDINLIESKWESVLDSCSKMGSGEKITMEAAKDCQDFLQEMNKVFFFINENLPKQVYGRSFRKEGDKYIEDPNGEYKSMRGMFGALWYVKKNFNQSMPGGKHIAPFD